MAEDPIRLSVIIPAYNEEAHIGSTLEDVVGYLARQPFTSEIIVVDDGSQDHTSQIAESMNGRFPRLRLLRHVPNRGKGYAVRQGMQAACGELALFMDADNSVSIRELDPFLARVKGGCEVAIASRYVPGSRFDPPQPRYRIILGKIYHWLSKLLITGGVSDYNCGFKLYTRRAREAVFSRQRMDDWSFDTELIFLAKRCGLRIAELPVVWRYTGTSKVHPVRDALQSFLSLLKMRGNAIRGVYR